MGLVAKLVSGCSTPLQLKSLLLLAAWSGGLWGGRLQVNSSRQQQARLLPGQCVSLSLSNSKTAKPVGNRVGSHSKGAIAVA